MRSTRGSKRSRDQLGGAMPVRLVLAAAILSLTACQVAPVPAVATPTPTPAGRADVGGTFRVALTADPTTLDPWNANDANTLLVTRQIFETLVDYEPGGFKIVPKLAESWSVSPDGRSWTFALRRGVKFHDGTDLDAAAVVLNFDRARQMAHPLHGAPGAAGTGPFVFRSGAWQLGQQVTLERNGAYWAKDPGGTQMPYVDRVVLRVIKDESARIGELRSGGLDAVRDVTVATLPTVKADPNLQLLPRPALNVGYLGIAPTAPFDKVEVRRAVAMAIDRSLLATTLYSGVGRPASQLLAPGMLGYDDSVLEFYRLDTAGAKRLLADGGVPSGFATELWYPPAWRAQYPDPKRVAESIAADLAKIGLVVSLRT